MSTGFATELLFTWKKSSYIWLYLMIIMNKFEHPKMFQGWLNLPWFTSWPNPHAVRWYYLSNFTEVEHVDLASLDRSSVPVLTLCGRARRICTTGTREWWRIRRTLCSHGSPGWRVMVIAAISWLWIFYEMRWAVIAGQGRPVISCEGWLADGWVILQLLCFSCERIGNGEFRRI